MAVQRGGRLPAALASEADVFSIVWQSLIRQGEKVVNGVSGDDREAAVLQVARRILTGVSGLGPGGAAFASLRSDGILMPYGHSSVWDAGDQFSSDVLRDFATARLLLREGLKVLVESIAPRWAIRATRLYSQAVLAQIALSSEQHEIPERWKKLRAEFGELSLTHGNRWAELPWEGLLTANWAEPLLTELTPVFQDEPEMQEELLRTVRLRFIYGGACDMAVCSPVISWLASNSGMIDHGRSYDEEPVMSLVLTWLRGLARRECDAEDISDLRPLRVRVINRLMSRDFEYSDQKQLESLGLFGSDSTDASTAAIRLVAETKPGFLSPLVESQDVARLMAKQNSRLLAELAGRYYIDRHSWNGFAHDEGIRSHDARGFGSALAAWYRGPFLPLLQANFSRGLQLINLMMDHGASSRIETTGRQVRSMGKVRAKFLTASTLVFLTKVLNGS